MTATDRDSQNVKEKTYLIYKLTSPSGKSYIGQTCRIEKRLLAHKTVSQCSAISAAIKKYGLEKFNIEILETELDLDKANILEAEYIKNNNTLFPNGYNLKEGGNNSKPSVFTRKRMSIARSSYKQPREVIEKARASNKGKKRSNEFRLNLSDRSKGVIPSIETIAKLSAAHKGKTLSEAHKAKISAAFKGRKPSPKAIAASVAVCKGKSLSEEHRKKLSEAHKGVPLNESHKKALRNRKHSKICLIRRSIGVATHWAKRLNRPMSIISYSANL